MVPVQQLVSIAPGQILAGQASYMQYRQLCIESCEREGREDGSDACNAGFCGSKLFSDLAHRFACKHTSDTFPAPCKVDSHWLQYANDCASNGNCDIKKVVSGHTEPNSHTHHPPLRLALPAWCAPKISWHGTDSLFP